MQLVDLTELTGQLLAIAAISKVALEMLKNQIALVKDNSNVKFALSILLSVIFTTVMNVSLVDTTNQVIFYIGTIGAGMIAGLGSNFIHEIMKVLQTLKGLNK